MILSSLYFTCLNSKCEKKHEFDIIITDPGQPAEKPSREFPGISASIPSWEMDEKFPIYCDCGVTYYPKFIHKHCQELFVELLNKKEE